ncbi:chorion peroxidase-like, partial [Stegodyphus dumicola]|uniref:chorion peroxidase-like n=1 Tax=Stegodyphus dumicola TaxID=202533 RepID=UPI0015B0130D
QKVRIEENESSRPGAQEAELRGSSRERMVSRFYIIIFSTALLAIFFSHTLNASQIYSDDYDTLDSSHNNSEQFGIDISHGRNNYQDEFDFVMPDLRQNNSQEFVIDVSHILKIDQDQFGIGPSYSNQNNSEESGINIPHIRKYDRDEYGIGPSYSSKNNSEESDSDISHIKKNDQDISDTSPSDLSQNNSKESDINIPYIIKKDGDEFDSGPSDSSQNNSEVSDIDISHIRKNDQDKFGIHLSYSSQNNSEESDTDILYTIQNDQDIDISHIKKNDRNEFDIGPSDSKPNNSQESKSHTSHVKQNYQDEFEIGTTDSYQNNSEKFFIDTSYIKQSFLDDFDFDKILDSYEEALAFRKHLNKKYQRINPDVTDINLNRNFNLDEEVTRREELQHIFEFIATETKMYEMPEETRDELIGKIQENPKFHEIVASCKKSLPSPECNSSLLYRTFDGTCNNLKHPTWGSILTCTERLLPAYYKGYSGFPESVKGGPLPDARKLSVNLFPDKILPARNVSQMFAFFGQLLSHDITLTPPSTIGGLPLQCCPEIKALHPQCMAVPYSTDDPFFSQFNYTCRNLVRSAVCPTCTLDQRRHLNQVTAFIDCSFVYGVNEKEASYLRTNDGTGKLRTQNGNLMPKELDWAKDLNCVKKDREFCFRSGDARGNQHTILAALHTIFVREHNRMATEMKQLNPHWDEETTFQETRRILGAVMQSITYKEFLPLLLGSNVMFTYKLWLNISQENSTQNPNIFIEFNTAAFRLHNLINTIVGENSTSNSKLLMRDTYAIHKPIHEGRIGTLLDGATKCPAHKFGRWMVDDVTKYMYRKVGTSFGLDIASTNIQRTRDHGIPPYIHLLSYCNDNKININNFDDLIQVMDSDNVELLKQNYKDVADIDAWVGMYMEHNNENAILPPTAACIVATQFKNIKNGDRFLFINRHLPTSFTLDQIRSIYHMSLSRLICDNTDVKEMQKNAMLFPSD